MPQYFICLRTPDAVLHQAERREFAGLREALVAANVTARKLIHRQACRAPVQLHGCLDIEDGHRQPVARILLADVARRIS